MNIHFNNIPHQGAYTYLDAEGRDEINSSGLSEHKETLSSELSFNLIYTPTSGYQN